MDMLSYQGENFSKNLNLVEKISAMAAEKGCTPAQLAIAWVLAQGEDVITISGTQCIKHLKENIASENIVLSTSELEKIEQIMPAGIVSSTCYPERFLSAVGR